MKMLAESYGRPPLSRNPGHCWSSISTDLTPS
jgi:hypothetical protein